MAIKTDVIRSAAVRIFASIITDLRCLALSAGSVPRAIAGWFHNAVHRRGSPDHAVSLLLVSQVAFFFFLLNLILSGVSHLTFAMKSSDGSVILFL